MSKTTHKIVSQDEWKKLREELLKKEKELTHKKDALTSEIRNLPWMKIEKNYIFDTVKGKETLADLFGKRSQLFVYHFMLGPGWEEGCPSCSFWADSFAGLDHHLPHRDVSFKVISRAPLAEIKKYQERMGWTFDWVSSAPSTFNLDIGVSEGTDDESPGVSIFYREGNDVYQTYFTTGRGLEVINPVYGVLDLVPKGRDEGGLEWPMAWVKRHDQYLAK